MDWGEYAHLKRLYYQINYILTDVLDDVAYLHAQFRRTNPNPYKRGITEPHAPFPKLPAKDELSVN